MTLVHKGNIQKFTEGAFRDWGYDLAREEFRAQIITERESWIVDNLDKNPQLTAEQNAAMIEPGLEQGTETFRNEMYAEVKSVIDSIYATHGRGQWKQKLLINDRIADSVFQQVLMRPEEYQVIATPESQRRLFIRRMRRASWRPRHGSRRKYRRRIRMLRSDAWNRSEICR